MVCSQQEKQKMDTLLEAFREYVDNNAYYDIVYSKKAGFLRVCVGEGADQIYFPITGFEDMLRMFIDDFLLDEEHRTGHYLRRDYDHVRTLLTPILDKLGGNQVHALDIMEQRFEDCKARCKQMRQERLLLIRETEELLENLRKSVTP